MVDAEMKAFCQGYCVALDSERAFMSSDLRRVDDWVVWRDYDINLFGADLDENLTSLQLRVSAYPAGWKDSLPKPLYDFVVGENK